MRIAVVKPDFGIEGGFERVLSRIVQHLRAADHDVRVLATDARRRAGTPYGIPVPDDARATVPEFVDYFGLVEQFSGLDAKRCDVVLSTQPPSFVVDHPRHLSLFYHHLRTYYDLAEVCMAAGLVDPTAHVLALDRVRRFDQQHLERVRWFLAGSEEVAERLAAFNGLAENVSVFHAGVGVGEDDGRIDPEPARSNVDLSGPPLCVSRHEFPKRTELFVHAMALLGDGPGVAVGGGGRLGWAKRLHLQLCERALDAETVDSRQLWMTAPGYVPPESVASPERPVVSFLGTVSDAELDGLYRRACCVVAPAYREDYGLTAIEAMRRSKPVIVCDDGGGLTAFVEHEVTGLVVEPTGRAIAAAIDRLRREPDLARQLGEAGRRSAATYTWARAMAEFDRGLDQVMS